MNLNFDNPGESPELLKRERYQMGMLWASVALIFLLTAGFQFLLGFLLNRNAPELLEKDWIVTLLSSGCMYFLAMPVAFLFFRMEKRTPPAERSMSFLGWLFALALCLILTYVGSFIGSILTDLLSLFMGIETENPVLELVESIPLWETFLLTVILAPLLEELFFRKLVIDRLRRYGDKFAVYASGILFGLIHGNLSQCFYAALLGIVFGYIYCHTGKIRYTVAMHMTVNFIGGVYAQQMADRLQPLLEGGNLMDAASGLPMLFSYLALYGAALAATPFALKYLLPRIHSEPGVVWLSPAGKAKVFFVNPGTWLLILTLAWMFLF